jgi:hypothetical protein
MDISSLAIFDETSIKSNQEIVKKTKEKGLLHKKMRDRYSVVLELPKETDKFEGIFEYADAYGKIRTGLFGSSFNENGKTNSDHYAVSLGGIVGIKTAKYKNINANIAIYLSQKIDGLNSSKNKQSYDFFDANGDSYVYMAESSINYNNDTLDLMFGRFVVDMPYANSDDTRMSQNSFEGSWANLKYGDRLSSQLFYISRWAGFDSQDIDAGQSQSKFKKFVDNAFGMFGASLAYRYNEESELSIWYHYIDKVSQIAYTELNGQIKFDSDEFIHMDYGLQYSHISQIGNSLVDGDVYGGMFISHYKELFLSLAYNYADVSKNSTITDGYGGGPYFTSLDEATISVASELNIGSNLSSYRLGIGYKFEDDSIFEGSTFEYAYGDIKLNNNYIKENNVILSLDYNHKIKIEATYANHKSKDYKLDRFICRIDYDF